MALILIDKSLLFRPELSKFCLLGFFFLLWLLLLKVKHVLGGSQLCRNISARNKWLLSCNYVYSVRNFHTLFSVVELLHLLIDVVFLTNLGSDGDPQVVPSITAKCLGLRALVGRQHFMNCSSFFTTRKSWYVRKRSMSRALTVDYANFRHLLTCAISWTYLARVSVRSLQSSSLGSYSSPTRFAYSGTAILGRSSSLARLLSSQPS